jgi:Glycoside Hydrolase Family 113
VSAATQIALGVAALLIVGCEPAVGQRLDGMNVIMAPGHSYGSASARRSLVNLKRLGAGTIAVVPFLWQSSPASPEVVRGSDMPDAVLRAAIRDAHSLGFTVMVKPHVWVPTSWAGAVAMASEDAWPRWFASYRGELMRIARLAADEKADALAIGTELTMTTQRPEWRDLIALVRAGYSGTLLYVAHNADEAETVPFWSALDAIGVSLYPPLGPDDDCAERRRTMRAMTDRLDALATRTGKSVVVAEIGLRSAQGAAAKPWESAEERAAAADPSLQAAVLADWLAALDRPAIRGIMIWRWFTDPDAGGPADTDFTVQGKPAERVLLCIWTPACLKP